ncbi:glycosyltransferase family 4 protein [Acinetobacter sp. YH1901134]|uniref:glycosyltransferase family 4 protein n=1 Tax=Acinetobacter sp. YH1901134 TaxID=2601199 RepID=UPI001C551F56|nr:glycosyltransferase family 4 protein [Acinetobacter sp. YH1901134]
MLDRKTFWIINQYSSTPETAMGGRHYYIAQELAKIGHKVYVIAGSYSHLLRSPKIFDEEFLFEERETNFTFIWVNLPKYDGAHDKKRIINEFIFSYKIRKLKNIIQDTPDVILHSSPALISYFGASYLASYFKTPYIFEVRDPWPLTLTEIGGYSKKHPFVRFLQWIEDRAYQRADFAFSNFFNAIEHMQSRGLEYTKFHWIPNGISLPEVENREAIDITVLNKIPKDKFIVGYTGTLGTANAMNYLIDAAELLLNSPSIHFVLVGDGKEKARLEKHVTDKNLTNVTFISSIPKKQIQSILEKFDACYIGWLNHRMYRLGIAANKLPEYLYSGKPIIHSYSGAGDFVRQANAGISIDAEKPQLIADAILELSQLPVNERQQMGERGKKFVLENLSYMEIATKIESIVLQSDKNK